MSQKILVPIAGLPESSPKSWEALEDAFSMDPNADFIVLHVFDPSEPANYIGESEGEIKKEDWARGDWEQKAEDIIREIFSETQELAEDFDVEISTVEKFGKPVDVILDYVEEKDIDRIVIGSHNKPSGKQVFLGSVAEAVARRSPVSVTIIR